MTEKRTRQSEGFTLIEALVSLVIMTMCVMAVGTALYTGLGNLREERRTLEATNHAEGKMGELIATEFAGVAGGSDQVTVGGQSVARQWSAALYDVDGDTVDDADAKLIVVTVDDFQLSTLLVDSVGEVTCKR